MPTMFSSSPDSSCTRMYFQMKHCPFTIMNKHEDIGQDNEYEGHNKKLEARYAWQMSLAQTIAIQPTAVWWKHNCAIKCFFSALQGKKISKKIKLCAPSTTFISGRLSCHAKDTCTHKCVYHILGYDLHIFSW